MTPSARRSTMAASARRRETWLASGCCSSPTVKSPDDRSCRPTGSAPSWNPDPDITEAFAQSESAPFMAGGWYRNQFWFAPRPHGPVLLCLGIYGQMVYVNPATQTVAAKLSSWPIAQSASMLHDTLRAFDTIGATLAGLPIEASSVDLPRPTGPIGVVAGLSRNRSAGSPGD